MANAAILILRAYCLDRAITIYCANINECLLVVVIGVAVRVVYFSTIWVQVLRLFFLSIALSVYLVLGCEIDRYTSSRSFRLMAVRYLVLIETLV